MCEKGKGRKVPCNEVNVFVIFPLIKSTKMSSLHNFLFFPNVESKRSVPLWKNYDIGATSCVSSSTTDFYLKICAAECCIMIFYLFKTGIIIFSKLDKCTFKTGKPCSKQNKTDASNFFFLANKTLFIYLKRHFWC